MSRSRDNPTRRDSSYVWRPRAHGEAFEVDMRKRGVGARRIQTHVRGNGGMMQTVGGVHGRVVDERRRGVCSRTERRPEPVLSCVAVSALELLWGSLFTGPDVHVRHGQPARRSRSEIFFKIVSGAKHIPALLSTLDRPRPEYSIAEVTIMQSPSCSTRAPSVHGADALASRCHECPYDRHWPLDPLSVRKHHILSIFNSASTLPPRQILAFEVDVRKRGVGARRIQTHARGSGGMMQTVGGVHGRVVDERRRGVCVCGGGDA
ncbi:hypothetical protein K438DRAFT_1754772 [Mycena galopus ATCC 62051]|nr:hypothetical protein K438DRAFT_1754772 [Mycena galopus ATCC 62051]